MNTIDIQQRVQRFETLCRERGLPLTVQRRDVFKAVLERDDHPSADQIYECVKDRIAGLSRTTVYRVLDRLVEFVRSRSSLHTDDFYIPRRPGAAGHLLAWARQKLWRLLRYQHDRMAFQQNLVNSQVTLALEFMRSEYRRQSAELSARLEQVEQALEGMGRDAGGQSKPCRDE